jgi:hypothetical protein
MADSSIGVARLDRVTAASAPSSSSFPEDR